DHVLNYRFQRSQNFIDIMRDYKCIHFHIGGIVFSSELYESGQLKFNESLSYWEDADMFNSIILSELKYGLLKDSHYYGHNNNETSLSRKIWSSEKRYTYHIKENYFSLIQIINCYTWSCNTIYSIFNCITLFRLFSRA